VGYCKQTAMPAAECVVLTDAKTFLRLPTSYTTEDTFITALIQAAREQGEIITGRSLAQRTFVMVLDSFPYYTDTVQSQLAYPPSYYSLPRYSTTLWNYSQMIKLPYAPVVSVQSMIYIDPSGNAQTLSQDTDFVIDRITDDPRIFPLPGTYWPPSLYVANSLEINFTAGYDPNPSAITTDDVEASPPFQQPVSTFVSGVPQMIRMGILNLVAYWFQNRGAGDVPQSIFNIFRNFAVYDFAGTRG
jgi:hypothetical protein